MKKIITLFAVFVSVATVGAQATINAPASGDVKPAKDSLWSSGGVAGANFSQVSLSNWSAGGEGAVAYNLLLNYNADYKTGKHLWNNRLELAYGMNWSKSKGAQKINDKIYLASMYGYELGRNWYLSALLNFSTQFANGFDYSLTPKRKISQFMSPGYLSAGLGFTWKPKSWFAATFSPAMWRGTFVLDDDLFSDAAGNPVPAYGVRHGNHFLSEFGANVRLEANKDIAKGVNLYSRLDLFSNYLKKPQNVDVRWDVALTATITKWLSANLTLNMIYDDDILFPRKDGTMGGSKFQVKEILGIGLQTAF